MVATLKLSEVILDAVKAKLQNGLQIRLETINAEKNDGITVVSPSPDDYYIGGMTEFRAPAIIVAAGDSAFSDEGPHSFVYSPQIIVFVVDQDANRQALTRKLLRLTRGVIETLWDDEPQEALAGSAFTLQPLGERPGPTERPEDDTTVYRSGRSVIFLASQAEN